jgi:2-desacetyl-2-hydroxyethyl bacteriochlorophyllide A dehydrogenase
MTTTYEAQAIWFEGPRSVSVRSAVVPEPGPGEFRVRAHVSLLSPGTERLLYRGQVASLQGIVLDRDDAADYFPFPPGYQSVGEVLDVGEGVPLRPGQLVFVRHSHQSVFTLPYDANYVAPLPEGLSPERGVFTNLAAVALNGLLDVPVRIGDHVIVFGQGIVGLFCGLLAARTAGRLWVVDPSDDRRERARAIGSAEALRPEELAGAVFEATEGRGVDVAFEASGAPDALQAALRLVGDEGSICVLSFYGSKALQLTLDTFHFRRHRIVSSMAATVGSGLQPRWNRTRRFGVVMDFLAAVPIEHFITHRFDISEAARAYELLDDPASGALGILVTYS